MPAARTHRVHETVGTSRLEAGLPPETEHLHAAFPVDLRLDAADELAR